jgi:orotidine-5'-phosphate decarboxylase
MHLARLFHNKIKILKVGSRLFTAGGPALLAKLTHYIPEIFLDLKFHDIPNTVAGAVRAAAELPGVRMLTLHASGGSAMMRAAREAAGSRRNRPKLLAVTVLTSLDAADLRRVGISTSPLDQVLHLAKLAKSSGMDGVVASPLEVAAIRKAVGPDFLIVVPGIRPTRASGSSATKNHTDDQRRVATPAAALKAGADYLVVGRPILDAANPAAAAKAILREMACAC